MTAAESFHENHSTDEDQAISRAIAILAGRLRSRSVLSSAAEVKAFFRLQSQGLAHEVFAVAYLDAQNRLIAYERMFRGTLTQTAVHPREIARHALLANAASVILHHNHPSGRCEPSASDVALTVCVKGVLALIDVGVLDHVITSDDGAVSMAQRGLM